MHFQDPVGLSDPAQSVKLFFGSYISELTAPRKHGWWDHRYNPTPPALDPIPPSGWRRKCRGQHGGGPAPPPRDGLFLWCARSRRSVFLSTCHNEGEHNVVFGLDGVLLPIMIFLGIFFCKVAIPAVVSFFCPTTQGGLTNQIFFVPEVHCFIQDKIFPEKSKCCIFMPDPRSGFTTLGTFPSSVPHNPLHRNSDFFPHLCLPFLHL